MEQKEIKALVQTVLAEAKDLEGYFIVRAQSRREWSMRLSNGRFERVSTGEDSGLGVHAFTETGASGFATSDVLEKGMGRKLLEKAIKLARRNEEIGSKGNRQIWEASPLLAEVDSSSQKPLGDVPLAELQRMVMTLHASLRSVFPGGVWQSSYRQIEEAWCIGRSDGTLVSFVIPRAVLMHQGTVRGKGNAQSTLIHRSGVDATLLFDELDDKFLEKKAVDRAKFALDVCDAPQLPSGHYPLIIDYGLAKGLAHEAFGHAVESDHMNESVLGDAGKLRKGLRVARPGVHIIDGPLTGDWANQPYSANGLPRETVTIVRDGVLEAGLGDIFSAEDAGIPVTGAGRAESYGHIPLPRMSNIRLLVDRMLPLVPQEFLMAEVKAVRETLIEHKELLKGQKNLLLLGYRGGQVNPKTGDFVFQCDGIIDVADPELPIYQPSIFSGKILSALKAIRGGLGEGRYDAIGTCGKGGQSVASSGGSHRYLLMDVDQQVSLGGEQL
ncbi:putative Zn-dependent protease-like protein [Desulfosporosinus orientis DSM 765]|uniref:Putative Zn-dependent protease-like protein n=1 Tax=Desulfosporosinus orientis (strain ATCC 19365 / DSM 765 / NCIMB 8382 / VKM B-1628 / Singapore I) TaxID=768706 RepID=G7WHF6_DESOD|nr:TldD/PmbA family protein [Desulfosporosinus orientis]AET70246.1 putative Zn-dependent protease-like protein [Desulfosporosinus orientis DSM 765]